MGFPIRTHGLCPRILPNVQLAESIGQLVRAAVDSAVEALKLARHSRMRGASNAGQKRAPDRGDLVLVLGCWPSLHWHLRLYVQSRSRPLRGQLLTLEVARLTQSGIRSTISSRSLEASKRWSTSKCLQRTTTISCATTCDDGTLKLRRLSWSTLESWNPFWTRLS